ncbi:MAG: Hsp20/alpha crystallin family protein [Polyangiaceae bacterium]
MTTTMPETTQQNGTSKVAVAQSRPVTKSVPELVLTPSVDVYENEGGVLVLVDLPGVEEKHLGLTVNRDVLTLTADRYEAGANERKITYRRTFVIPNNVDTDAIEAKLDKGELELTLPRRKESMPRQIPIGSRRS